MENIFTTNTSNVEIGDYVINISFNYIFIVNNENDKDIIITGFKNGKRNIEKIICSECKNEKYIIRIDNDNYICKDCVRKNKIITIKNKIKKL